MSQSFRNERATELRNLAQILQRKGIVGDPGPLFSAATDCHRDRGNYWGYSLEGLVFRSLGQLKTVPYPINDLSLKLTIDIRGVCSDNVDSDPFEEYNFQLVIFGSYKKQGDHATQKVTNSWHLDRHVPTSTENEPRFLHPHYHLQFGGHVLKETVNEDVQFSGQVLLIDSPRIPFPPLDALLGIDFVLTNFINSGDIRFREQGDYANQLKRMQERLWKSYTIALASRWQPNHNLVPWPCNHLWPQFM